MTTSPASGEHHYAGSRIGPKSTWIALLGVNHHFLWRRARSATTFEPMGSRTPDGGKGPRATVRRERLVGSPHLPWNAFIDLLSGARYEELTEIQRVAFLAFRYDCDVQNGGHLRYFRNHGTERLRETTAALARLQAVPQAAVLERAGSEWRRAPTGKPLERLDDDYHACHPDVPVRLEAWFEAHMEEFIVFEDEPPAA